MMSKNNVAASFNSDVNAAAYVEFGDSIADVEVSDLLCESVLKFPRKQYSICQTLQTKFGLLMRG